MYLFQFVGKILEETFDDNGNYCECGHRVPPHYVDKCSKCQKTKKVDIPTKKDFLNFQLESINPISSDIVRYYAGVLYLRVKGVFPQVTHRQIQDAIRIELQSS